MVDVQTVFEHSSVKLVAMTCLMKHWIKLAMRRRRICIATSATTKTKTTC